MVEKSRKSVKTVCVGSSWSPTLQRQHETAPLVLFSPNEVPPDSQAWLSIFKNRSSVSNIINVTPSYIGGVDGGSQGLRINQEKDFEELGRVACKTIAAANSLSKARPLTMATQSPIISWTMYISWKDIKKGTHSLAKSFKMDAARATMHATTWLTQIRPLSLLLTTAKNSTTPVIAASTRSFIIWCAGTHHIAHRDFGTVRSYMFLQVQYLWYSPQRDCYAISSTGLHVRHWIRRAQLNCAICG